jgi:hypothetical protein
MKTVRFPRMLASALAPIGGLLIAAPAAADLVLNFNNDRPDASTLPAYITFTGAAPGGFDATNVLTGAQLQEGVSYSLSTLADGVDVINYTSGLVFVSLGSPLIGLTASTNYAPNFVSPTSANFLTRMDKYEITYGVPASGGAPTGGANLSSTDFFGIPLKLQTKGGSQPTTLTWNYNGAVNTAAVFQSRRARGLRDRHVCQHPWRPGRQRRQRRHDQHAWRTHERGGSHHRAKQHEWKHDTVPKLRQLRELSPDRRDLGQHRGSERTVLIRLLAKALMAAPVMARLARKRGYDLLPLNPLPIHLTMEDR